MAAPGRWKLPNPNRLTALALRRPESEFACVAEAAGTPGRVAKLLSLDQLSTSDGCDNELGDALLRADRNRMLPEVDQDHFYLAAIISVDGSGGIQYGQSIGEGAAASSPHLPLKPWWYFDRDPSRNCGP